MQVIIANDKMTISGATPGVLAQLQSELTYTDKAKQYQLRRLSRTRWGQMSPLYKQLQAEVSGHLYEMNGNDLICTSALYEHVKDFLVGAVLTDLRKETGKKIVVPWVKKPFPLRPYQEEAVDLFLNNWRGLGNLATGLGKTLIATHLIQRYKKRTLVICPLRSNSILSLSNALENRRLVSMEAERRILVTLQLASLLQSLETFKSSPMLISDLLYSMKLITRRQAPSLTSPRVLQALVGSLVSQQQITAAMEKIYSSLQGAVPSSFVATSSGEYQMVTSPSLSSLFVKLQPVDVTSKTTN
jgi:hypothetical protein